MIEFPTAISEYVPGHISARDFCDFLLGRLEQTNHSERSWKLNVSNIYHFHDANLANTCAKCWVFGG